MPGPDRGWRALEDRAVLGDQEVPGSRPIDASPVGLDSSREDLRPAWATDAARRMPDQAKRVLHHKPVCPNRRQNDESWIADISKKPSPFIDTHQSPSRFAAAATASSRKAN